jgi:ribose transport system substrate-binding protein
MSCQRRLKASRVVAIVMSVCILFVSACSSSKGSASAPPSSGAGGSNAIPQAQQLMHALETRPTQIPVTDPITRPIPSGKTIDWMACGSPECTSQTAPLEAAAAVLGWKIHTINAGLTPETILSAWNLAVQEHPDGVLGPGLPKIIYAKPLATLGKEKIPVVNEFTADEPGGGLTAVVPKTPQSLQVQGKAAADVVLGQDGKSANTLFIGSTTYAGLVIAQNSFQAEYSRLCPSCGFAVYNVPATEVSTKLPGDIVAYLSSHPKVNYIVAGQGSSAIGLPQALKAAGLKASILTFYPDSTTVEYLKAGLLSGVIMYEMSDVMWQMIDTLARYFAGQSVVPSEQTTGLWLLTKSNVSQLSAPYALVPGYEAQYKKLWNK